MPETVMRFPLDFETLHRGDLISAERIARIVEEPIGSDKYRIEAMQLANQIKEEIYDRTGDLVYVKFEGDSLRLLTHAEQAEYTDRRFNGGIRGLGRTLAYQQAVHRSDLDDDQLKVHDRKLEVNGRIMSAIRTTKRELSHVPVKREMPTGGEGRKAPTEIMKYGQTG